MITGFRRSVPAEDSRSVRRHPGPSAPTLRQHRSTTATLTALGLAVFTAVSALALPPLETVLSGTERFRSLTEHVRGSCRLSYSTWRRTSLQLDRPWNAPPQLTGADTALELDWNNGDLDLPLRLVGAALGAEDLSQALHAMGRSLEPELQTLALLGDDVVYVIGGPLSALTPHVIVERETYRLRAVEIPMPDGIYRVELNRYTLADGWFPSEITVTREGAIVLELVVDSISAR